MYTINSSELSPKEFDYVGIKLEYDERDHAFSLSQPGIIEKITADVAEIVDLPCDVKSREETDGMKLNVYQITIYQSDVMTINFASKVRPDIKVALGYLATRMQSPAKGDVMKLQRLKKYTNGTKACWCSSSLSFS
jgi:hypothetical protein